MGNYSFFNDEDIEVLDYENLKRVVEILREEGNEYAQKELLKLDDDEKSISFKNWDDMKIISYWYDDMVLLLNLISPYIEGKIRFTFETIEENAIIQFTDGKCIIELGNMNYDSVDCEELYRKETKLSKKLKELKDDLEIVRTEKKI